MENIEIIHKMNSDTLRSDHYFQSLLEEALNKGIMTEAQLETVQLDSISLLAKQTRQYTSGESSSVRVETAQQLLASILYTIGVYLKTCSSPEEAIKEVTEDGLTILHHKGLVIIDKMIKSTKALHRSIIKNLIQTKNVFYSATIVEGIQGFFKLYSPDFSAQEIHITADYPIHHPKEPFLGIEFIRNYLECIYYENLFCSQFTPDTIHHLLCAYESDYSQLLINLYEPILLAAVGCILTDKEVLRLELDAPSIELLERIFTNKSRNEIQIILEKSVLGLCEMMEFREPLQQYLKDSIPQLAIAVENGILLHTLDRVFLCPVYPELQPRLSVSFGKKMENQRYRRLLKNLKFSHTWEDKKDMIKRELHSLADLADVLMDSELSELEIFDLLKELSLAELAALILKYPMPAPEDRYEMREGELFLCDVLQKFFANLSEIQREKIRDTERMLRDNRFKSKSEDSTNRS